MKRIAKVTLVVVLLICGVVRIGWCKENAEQYKKDLLHIQGLLEAANRYDQGFLFAEQAYAYALEHLGPKDPATLNSMNNLARLYRSQGWDSKAELLYKNKKALAKKQTDTLIKLKERQHANITQMPAAKNTRIFQPRKKTLRQVHSDTLTSINNLAFFYQDQGRYSEAEPLLKKALQIREKKLGREHPDTLTSIQSLALLYQDQGRYTEVRPLFEEVVRLRKKVIGREHPDTLSSMNSLATLYVVMGRDGEIVPGMKDIYGILENSGVYEKAKAVYEKELQDRKKELGQEYIDRLTSVKDFDVLDVLDSVKNGLRDFDTFHAQKFYSKAEALYDEALQARKKVLGDEHPDTLTSINGLATLYCAQGRYSEAESLYNETLMLRKKVLGWEHPDTLTSMNDLAVLCWEQGRYTEAEHLLEKTLRLRGKVLGREHPNTLDTQKKYIVLLVSSNKPAKALVQLKHLEDQLATRSFQELYAASDYKVRLQYLHTISYFRDMAFSLAAQQSGEKYQRFAANTILRWKQIYSEENLRQHRQLDFNKSQEVNHLKEAINQMRAKLSQSLRIRNNEELSGQTGQLNEKERNLALLLRESRSNLAVKKINFEQIASKIPSGSCLVDYCLFRRLDFKSRKIGEHHLAVLVLFPGAESTGQFIFQDLGPMSAIFVKDFVLRDNGDIFRYDRLLGLFDDRIKYLKRLYIAPDYWLNIFPFAALTLPDGRFLAERQQINRLQTGRDLLENGKDFQRGKGLVAFGGAEYGELPASQSESTPNLAASYQKRAARLLRAGVGPLPNSEPEVQTIKTIFTNNISEDAQVFLGNDASEYNLKHLKQPPRILHLSTHGFSLWGNGDAGDKLANEAPLLLSGLALAGANNGLQGKLDKHGDDGLLYSLEVLGLNLHGTELVSLSACETGQGVMDYSEGVYGLVRAFRTAGAANVLMTLISVGDKSSRDFMETFYDNWLYPDDPEKEWVDGAKKNTRSPAEALHQTRLDFIHHKNPAYRDPAVWSPYVLVGK